MVDMGVIVGWGQLGVGIAGVLVAVAALWFAVWSFKKGNKSKARAVRKEAGMRLRAQVGVVQLRTALSNAVNNHRDSNPVVATVCSNIQETTTRRVTSAEMAVPPRIRLVG